MDSDAAKRLKEAAEIIRKRAAGLSSWSSRIPRSLEISEEEYAVVISANSEIAPDASAYELGKRHPLWAQGGRSGWNWGPTPHRPFLEPAVDSDEAVETCAMVVTDWAIRLGCKP